MAGKPSLPRTLLTSLSHSPLRPGDKGEEERAGGPPDHAQKELPLNCSGEEA